MTAPWCGSTDRPAPYVSYELWKELSALVEREARALLGQGRWLTVQTWIERMPIELVRANAALQYWLGTALLAHDHAAARTQLARAHALYVDLGDPAGQVESLSGIIEAIFFETNDHSLMDPWIQRLSTLLHAGARTHSSEAELRAYAALMIATLYRQPGNPVLLVAAARVFQLIDADASADRRLAAAALYLVFCSYTGRFDDARLAYPRGDALAGCEDVSPHNQGLWLAWKGYLCQLTCDYETGAAVLVRAQEIGKHQGLRSVEFVASCFLSSLHGRAGWAPHQLWP